MDIDYFGQPVSFNFKQSGDQFTSAHGGIFSLLMLTLYFLYFRYHFLTMWNFDGNDENSFVEIQTYKDKDGKPMKDINMMNDTNVFQFFILSKQRLNDAPLYFNETTKKYIDIRYMQLINDYTVEDGSANDWYRIEA